MTDMIRVYIRINIRRDTGSTHVEASVPQCWWTRDAKPPGHIHGFDEADIFRQINLRDLAAEFAKKKQNFLLLSNSITPNADCT